MDTADGEERSVMRPRDQKTILTKLIKKCIYNQFQIITLKATLEHGKNIMSYAVNIVPGSLELVAHYTVKTQGTTAIREYTDHPSPSTFSDFIVRHGGFEHMLNKFNAIEGI